MLIWYGKGDKGCAIGCASEGGLGGSFMSVRGISRQCVGDSCYGCFGDCSKNLEQLSGRA